jgi:glycosyltransferase involved in cell wall biosynthesis
VIERKTTIDDIVLYLTNIPPIKKHKCKTFLLLQNRYVIEGFPLSGFPIKTKLRIFSERLLFWLNKKNIDYIIVQSESMLSVLVKTGIIKEKIKIIASKDKIINAKCNRNHSDKLPNTFLYVSSDEPHKNHKKLIDSWCLLSIEDLFPKLILTIDENTNVHKYVLFMVDKFNLDVDIMPNLKRDQIIELYCQSTALIYPSLFESYGLPLVESDQFELPVLASELDYVRDILDPVETFDPNSTKSISRAVKRFLKIKEEKTKIVEAKDLLNSVIDYD